MSARDEAIALAMAQAIGHGMAEKCINRVPAFLAALDAAGMAVLSKNALRLRTAPAQGTTLAEMREAIRQHDLYRHGDAVLRWVNEGDLAMIEVQGAMLAAAKEDKR
jgi:hypothetical protein